MIVAVEMGQALGIALSRWGHVIAGITWIGLLYYFNFVQVPSFAQFEAAPRTEAVRKLVPRALWWFRWAALLTFLTGIMILVFQEQLDDDYFNSTPGLTISIGMLMAIVMFANVWLVIWPNQKVVIANAEATAAGRDADPNAAAAGRKALLASRTNTLLSIPMLFLMVATSHFVGIVEDFNLEPESGKRMAWLLIMTVIIALLELNALGYLGGTGPGPTRKPLEDHKQTIIAGLVLLVIVFVLMLIFFSD